MILSSILLPKLTPYNEEITGDHQWGFRRYRSTTDQTFCIQVMEKYGCASVIYGIQANLLPDMREVFYSVVIHLCIPMKVVRLIEICSLETLICPRW
jgi:hypothetical protein